MKVISFQSIGDFILVFSLSCLFLTVIQGMGNLCSPNVLMISLGMGLVFGYHVLLCIQES